MRRLDDQTPCFPRGQWRCCESAWPPRVSLSHPMFFTPCKQVDHPARLDVDGAPPLFLLSLEGPSASAGLLHEQLPPFELIPSHRFLLCCAPFAEGAAAGTAPPIPHKAVLALFSLSVSGSEAVLVRVGRAERDELLPPLHPRGQNKCSLGACAAILLHRHRCGAEGNSLIQALTESFLRTPTAGHGKAPKQGLPAMIKASLAQAPVMMLAYPIDTIKTRLQIPFGAPSPILKAPLPLGSTLS